jgi:ribosome biogenesis GTPase
VPTIFAGALSAYGWSDRVLALFNDFASLGTDDDPGAVPARVVRVERSSCSAVFSDGAEQLLQFSVLPAVGDWVVASQGWARHVLPRWSSLTRLAPDPRGDGKQVLAANIDIVFIAAPADRLSAALVERELAIAWDSGAQPVVVLTKADLAAPGAVEELSRRLVGADLLVASTVTGEGMAELRQFLAPGKTAVFLGPSGAGKSTLANALLGGDILPTGAVREGDHRGRHTTTWRQLVSVPSGGALIDTPGVRSLGLPGDVSIGDVFVEIEILAPECHFDDCRHEGEPGCAVALAVARGELDPERLGNFHKMQREIAAERRRFDPLARKAELRIWKERTKAVRAHDKRKVR